MACLGAKKLTSTTSIALIGNISNQKRQIPLLSLFQIVAGNIKRSAIGTSQVIAIYIRIQNTAARARITNKLLFHCPYSRLNFNKI
jgi:hypothetical protein